ncbi:Bbp16 family capsid cement protein [Pseudaquabacterium pictum]|uniref:Uncharacterized protein n=1 Tax=Pseudaquabacterium pictum TaxID=2315236 RepID=A0A480AVK9_9BURK|nr:hypothetical protein [Rubrivivax pictus]GCL64950.1 hypothetical protein AQPW35_40310 [Rubrivivax pictus]
MILDQHSELGTAVALNTGAAGTYNLGDVIDTQGQQIGAGNSTRALPGAYLVVLVSTTATSGGAATAQFRLVSDSTSTPSTSTPTVHASSGPLALAALTAGRRVFCISCEDLQGAKRYLGLQQITAGAAFTGGAVSIFFTSDPSAWRATADNVL